MIPKTILIATKATDIHDRFSTALQSAGHRALLASNVSNLLEQLSESTVHVDLVVLDLRIQVTGVELVRKLRALNSKLPIIILSGSVQTAAEARELINLGIASYVNEYSAVQHILPSLAPQLFPDSFNRRTSVRVTLGIPLAIRVEESITAALMLNLGKGGIGVRTMNPIDTGIKVNIRFRLPGYQQDINATSKVTWSDSRSGMGVQFEYVEPREQSAIDEFVDQQLFTDESSN